MKKSVTLSDIARESGVSRQVVSAILNPQSGGNIRYSTETYERVIKAAKRMHYRPNRAATSLVKNRHGALGILINRTGAIPSKTLQYLLQMSKDRDLIISIESYTDSDGEQPIFLKEDCVDGIILFENFDTGVIQQIETLGIPAVYVNTNLTNSPNAITFDESDAMDQAAALFKARGRSAPVIVLPNEQTFNIRNHYSINARRTGLIEAARTHKLSPPLEITEDIHWGAIGFDTEAHALYKAFLEKHPEIDCAVLYNDMQAPAFYQAVYDTGKRIPEDIAVLGIHFSAQQTRVLPGLSILQIDPETLADTIITELEKKQIAKNGSESTLIMKYNLLEFGST